MTAQLGLLPPTANEHRAEETDTAERSDDPTPRGIPRAVLAAAVRPEVNPHLYAKFCAAKMFAHAPEIPHVNAVRVLDVCAGHGAWASEMRRLAHLQGWPVHITGVELHAPRESDLLKWCDSVMMGDWKRPLVLRSLLRSGANPIDAKGFDLVIGNPHFPALTGDGVAPSMPETLLEHAPAVLLLHTQQAFLRGSAGRAAWRRCPPAACWLVPGAVGFRGPGEGTDARCYQVSLWLRGHTGPTSTHLLPELAAEARRWRVPPGSEQPSADLPAAPGWTP